MALMAMPSFAQQQAQDEKTPLANVLDVTLATNWEHGFINGVNVTQIRETGKYGISLDFPGEDPARRDLIALDTTFFDRVNKWMIFRVQREETSEEWLDVSPTYDSLIVIIR